MLNLFGGVLVFKRKAEEALEASGLPYVIVRPGGMERPRDDYKLTHNVRLATRDKLFGGQVSRLQVAELVAAAAASPELAENKVLEVVAETGAPALSYDELLAAHPAGAYGRRTCTHHAFALSLGPACEGLHNAGSRWHHAMLLWRSGCRRGVPGRARGGARGCGRARGGCERGGGAGGRHLGYASCIEHV